MVPGQNAEPSRVDRQDLGQAELGREVRDALAAGDELAGRRVPRLGEVLLGQATDGRAELLLVGRIVRGPPEALGRNFPEEAHGIAAGALPRLGVQDLEERPQLRTPRPAQVVREGEERKEFFGDAGNPKCLFENGCQLGGILADARGVLGVSGLGARDLRGTLGQVHRELSPERAEALEPSPRVLESRVGLARPAGQEALPEPVVGVLRLPEIHLERELPREIDDRLELLEPLERGGVGAQPVGEALERELDGEREAILVERDADVARLLEDRRQPRRIRSLLFERAAQARVERELRRQPKAARLARSRGSTGSA